MQNQLIEHNSSRMFKAKTEGLSEIECVINPHIDSCVNFLSMAL